MAAPESTTAWRTSSYSGDNGACVQLAALPDGRIAVRDSKHPEGAMLVFTRIELRAWVQGARAGEFDDLI